MAFDPTLFRPAAQLVDPVPARTLLVAEDGREDLLELLAADVGRALSDVETLPRSQRVEEDPPAKDSGSKTHE